MSRCWEVIDAQAQLALDSEGFSEIDIETLKQILQRETLNCKEVLPPLCTYLFVSPGHSFKVSNRFF